MNLSSASNTWHVMQKTDCCVSQDDGKSVFGTGARTILGGSVPPCQRYIFKYRCEEQKLEKLSTQHAAQLRLCIITGMGLRFREGHFLRRMCHDLKGQEPHRRTRSFVYFLVAHLQKGGALTA